MKFVNQPWGIRLNLTFVALVFTLVLYWMYKENKAKMAPSSAKVESRIERATESKP
ncbi:MAG: hypothetical protein LCH63_12950 [Candidatus Melainabacteria bacterium]|jgi:hypothetical protein|nr:hypothetical protein [Candidatus Melainabacteria bacterium]